jgi:hypothetical protein
MSVTIDQPRFSFRNRTISQTNEPDIWGIRLAFCVEQFQACRVWGRERIIQSRLRAIFSPLTTPHTHRRRKRTHLPLISTMQFSLAAGAAAAKITNRNRLVGLGS